MQFGAQICKIKWFPQFRGFPYSNLSGKKVFFAMLVVGLIVLSILVLGVPTTHEGGSDARNYTSFHAEMDVEYDPENGRTFLSPISIFHFF